MGADRKVAWLISSLALFWIVAALLIPSSGGALIASVIGVFAAALAWGNSLLKESFSSRGPLFVACAVIAVVCALLVFLLLIAVRSTIQA